MVKIERNPLSYKKIQKGGFFGALAGGLAKTAMGALAGGGGGGTGYNGEPGPGTVGAASPCGTGGIGNKDNCGTGGSGTVNKGGGGGGSGGSYNPSYNNSGGAGGSGVVLLRIATACKPGSFAVAPGTNTTGVDGSCTVATFTVSGTLTL